MAVHTMGGLSRDVIRRNYSRLCESKQPVRIAAEIGHLVGYCSKDGKRYIDPKTGDPCLNPEAKHKPSELDLRMVTEAILGEDWPNLLGLNNSGQAFPRFSRVQESDAAPIGPSTFMNVAAWSSTIGGLLGATVLEGYEQAEYDMYDLFPTKQAIFWQGGERYIDIMGPYTPAQEIGPGEPHPAMKMDGLWVEPGPMKKYGGKLELLKETTYIDITGGQIMAKAKTLGEMLKFRQNELALDITVGQTQNFKLGFLADSSATTYNTYNPTTAGPNGSYALVNDSVNPLNDIGALQISDRLISNLRNPVSLLPINLQLNTLLLPTPLATWAQLIQSVGAVSLLNQTTAGPAQAAPGTFPNSMQTGQNPYGKLTPVVSRWLDYRHQLSTTSGDPNMSPGLGLTGAAIYRWYRMDPTKFACRRIAWDMNVIDLNPNDYVMANQNIVAGQVANIAVMYQVLNPWAIQRNKGS